MVSTLIYILVAAENFTVTFLVAFAVTSLNMSTLSKIADIEHEILRTQKNKATECHLGVLKAKLAKLKAEVLSGSKTSGGKAGDGFDVTKSGDIRVGMVGFPSVGKSSLLTKLTGTSSEVAAYEFTTLSKLLYVL